MIIDEAPVRFTIEWPTPNEKSIGDHKAGIPSNINYGTIFTALQDAAQERYFPYLPDFLINDGIKDAHELVEAFITKADSEDNEAKVSNPVMLRRMLFNGHKYNIATETFARCNPIPENTLKLVMNDNDDSMFYSLTFSQPYITWKWFYLLRMLLRVWGNECQKEDLNNNQLLLRTTGVLVTLVGMPGSESLQSCSPQEANLTLDVDQAYKIILDGGKHLDIRSIYSIILSSDFFPETGLSIDILPSNVSVIPVNEKKRPSFTDVVSTVAYLAEEATIGTAKRAKMVAQTTANLISSTIPSKKQESAVRRFQQRQVDYVLLKFLESEQAVAACVEDASQESRIFRLDYFIPTSKMMASSIRFPFERCDGLMFFYKGGSPLPFTAMVLEYEQLETWLKLSELISNPKDLDRVGRLMIDFNNPRREVKALVPLEIDSELDLSVTVLRAENVTLNTSSSFWRISGINNLSSVQISAKCRLVNSGRHMLEDAGHSCAGIYDADAETIEWGNASWRYKLMDQVDALRYVRVELSLEGRGGSSYSLPTSLKFNHESSLGAIFIPLSSFTHHPKELVFPLDDFRLKRNVIRPGAASITVFIQLISRQIVSVATSVKEGPPPISAPKAFALQAPAPSTTTVAKTQLSITAESYFPDDVWYPTDSLLAGEVNTNTASSMLARSNGISIEKVAVKFGRRALMIETNRDLVEMSSEVSASQPIVFEYMWRKMMLSQVEQEQSSTGFVSGCILRTCQEAQAKSSLVRIDYQQVEKVEVVSPGLICITIMVLRFLPAAVKENAKNVAASISAAANSSRYVPVSVELFIGNVRSKHIALLLDDRRHFASIRKNFLSIVLGNQYEDEDARASDAVVLSIEMGHLASSCRSDVHNLLDNVSDTDIADISAGITPFSRSVSKQSGKAGEQYDPATASIPIHFTTESSDKRSSGRCLPMQIWSTVRQFGSRECRLRMYEAALYGIGLQGAHDFDPKQVRDLLKADIAEGRAMLNAETEDDTIHGFDPSNSSTSQQQAEADAAERFASACQFLVSMAEKRIRETAIAGWSRRGEGNELEQCLTMLIEGYFNSILTMMRPIYIKSYFDSIKGLQIKLRYITFVLQNHDQWKTFLASALRPYRIQITPEPRISAYIHPERLVGWYHDSVKQDMLLRLRHIFQVWQDQTTSDRSKSATKDDSLYQCNVVPWIPQRECADKGCFFSGIPEDFTSFLNIYLQYSVLKREDIHAQYAPLAENAQRELLVMFIQMFRVLRDGYEAALIGDFSSISLPSSIKETIKTSIESVLGSEASASDNAKMSSINQGNSSQNKKIVLQNEQMAAEYATWLCSIANDCYRIVNFQLVTKDVPPLYQKFVVEDKVVREIHKVYRALQETIHHSMEQLSTIIFHVIFQERGQWTTYDQIIQSISSATISGNEVYQLSPNRLNAVKYVPVAKDVRHCLEDFVAFLHPACVLEYLLPICEDRLAVFLLSLLRAMRNRGLVLQQSAGETVLQTAIELEIDALLTFREKLLRHIGHEPRASHLTTLFRQCKSLLLADIHASEIVVTINEMMQHAKTAPEDASALLRWLKISLSLRGFTKYFTASITMAKVVEKVRDNATTAASSAAAALVHNVAKINNTAGTETGNAVPAASEGVNTKTERTSSSDQNQRRSSFPLVSAILSTAAGHHHHHESGPASSVTTEAVLDSHPKSNSKSHSLWRPISSLWHSTGPNFGQNSDRSLSKDHPRNVSNASIAKESDEEFGCGESASGKFTTEMLQLREQLQLEWIDTVMQELSNIASEKESTNTPTVPTTDAIGAKISHLPFRRPLLRMYQSMHASPSAASSSSSTAAAATGSSVESSSGKSTASTDTVPETLPNNNNNSKTSVMSEIAPILHWCFDSRQFDFHLANIFQVHGTAGDASLEPSEASSATGTEDDDLTRKGSQSRLLRIGRGHVLLSAFETVVVGGVTTATQATQAALSLVMKTAAPATYLLPSPSGVLGGVESTQGRRPWRALFQRRSVAAPSVAPLQGGTEADSDSDKLLVSREAIIARSSKVPPKLTVADQLNQLNIAVDDVGKSPRSPLTTTGQLKVSIRRLRVLGTLHFVLFSAPKFALHLRLGSQTFVTRPSSMRTVHLDDRNGNTLSNTIPEPTADHERLKSLVLQLLSKQPGSHASTEYLYEFLDDGEEISFSLSVEKPGTGSSSALSAAAASSTGWVMGKTNNTLQISLLDTGVLVDQTLAKLQIPITWPMDGSDAHDPFLSEVDVQPFQSFSSALRVQRAVKVAKQSALPSQSHISTLPRLSCQLSITKQA